MSHRRRLRAGKAAPGPPQQRPSRGAACSGRVPRSADLCCPGAWAARAWVWASCVVECRQRRREGPGAMLTANRTTSAERGGASVEAPRRACGHTLCASARMQARDAARDRRLRACRREGRTCLCTRRAGAGSCWLGVATLLSVTAGEHCSGAGTRAWQRRRPHAAARSRPHVFFNAACWQHGSAARAPCVPGKPKARWLRAALRVRWHCLGGASDAGARPGPLGRYWQSTRVCDAAAPHAAQPSVGVRAAGRVWAHKQWGDRGAAFRRLCVAPNTWRVSSSYLTCLNG